MNVASKRWTWPLLKGALALAVLAAIGAKFYGDLRELDRSTFTLQPLWLLASGLIYLVALLPSAWYWNHILRVFGDRPRPLAVLRAYFMGHMGKYLPGKAWGVLLRAGYVSGPETRFGVAVITTFYEVLTTMAAGALLAAVIFAFDPPNVPGLPWHPLLTGLLLLATCGVPLLPVVFNFMVARMAARFQQVDSFRLPRLGPGTLIVGLASTAVGWLLYGLAVWAMLQGVLPQPPEWSVATWMRCTGSIALALVAGFLIVFLPSGIGARELFLRQLLGSGGTDPLVTVAVLLLRLVWTTVEVAVTLVLLCIRERPAATLFSPLPSGGEGRRGQWTPHVISIVIPVYNEKDSLALLYDEIAQSAAKANLETDVIFVDDGSRDGSWDVIADLARRHPQVRGIRFRRNFGKAAALSAGFTAARGAIVMTLDADLQDDPAEIPAFLTALAHGKDVVSGWKRLRHDPWHKVLPSRVFNRMVSWLTGVQLHDHNCGMKCYRAEVLREIRLYGELHRFIPVLADARGFKVGEVVINHRPRRFGSSKYGVRRFIKGFLDLLTVKFLTGFGQRPQHLLGSIGLVSFLIGNVLLLYLAVIWVIRLWDPTFDQPLHQRPLLIYAVAALLLGAQMMSMGFLAELITAYTVPQRETYSIAETTEQRPPLAG